MPMGEQLGDPGEPAGRREQSVDPHPLVVVDLREVAPAAVRQEDDNHLAGTLARPDELARDRQRGHERRAA